MSTDEDNAAPMVTDLATATELIRAVAHEARATAPALDVADLYSLGATLDELTSALAHITDQCADQARRYPEGRILRDDSDSYDSAVRCAEAAAHLRQVSRYLNLANVVGREYHSTIGHVGIEAQLGPRRLG